MSSCFTARILGSGNKLSEHRLALQDLAIASRAQQTAKECGSTRRDQRHEQIGVVFSTGVNRRDATLPAIDRVVVQEGLHTRIVL
jgi:hypothetical protein